MVTYEIKNTLKHAISELRRAESELNRPHEDVVTMSVCLSAKNAMKSFMQLFLLSRDQPVKPGSSLSSLLSQCRQLEKEFDAVNLERVSCNHLDPAECDHKYCLSARTVKECVSAARHLKVMVLSAMEINEAELV